MTSRIGCVLFAIGLLVGCKASDNTVENDTMMEATGTIQYVDLEGGFYGIVTDEGVRYDPTNLEEEFREDGLRVRFRARERTDVLTIRMWGTPIDLVSIDRQ